MRTPAVTHPSDPTTCHAVVELREMFCSAGEQLQYFSGYKEWTLGSESEVDPMYDQYHGKISAIAELLIQSKLTCTATGSYAYACGGTWAHATSFAGAAYEAYAAAWADASSGHCDCGVDVLASADVVISGWAEIWAKIYGSLDDSTCVGTGMQICLNAISPAFKSTNCLPVPVPHCGGFGTYMYHYVPS